MLALPDKSGEIDVALRRSILVWFIFHAEIVINLCIAILIVGLTVTTHLLRCSPLAVTSIQVLVGSSKFYCQFRYRI